MSGVTTNDTDLTVKVSLTGTGAVTGDTIQLYSGTGTGTPLGTSYTLLASDITAPIADDEIGARPDGTTDNIPARITDAAGNQSAVSSNTFTVTEDTSAPSAPEIGRASCRERAELATYTTSGVTTNDTDLTVKVSLTGTGAVAGDTIQLYDGTGTGTPLGTSYTLLASDITATFANGQPCMLTVHTSSLTTARITDAAGNQSAVSSNTFTVTEDTSAPSAP